MSAPSLTLPRPCGRGSLPLPQAGEGLIAIEGQDPMHSPLWVVELEVPRAAGPVFADLLGGLADDFSCFESGAAWRFAAYLAREPARGELAALTALAAAAAGIAPPAFTLGPLPARDWLAENRRQFPPVRAGRFFVHGTAFAGRVPPGCVALALDAGLAFGSGEHASTRGCLLALDRLARRRRRIARSLDLGCGSGILALAMAKRWRGRVVAADIDPVALAVARANARRNGVAAFVRTVRSDARGRPVLRKGRRYDLILANILARPLARLAPAIAQACRRGGRVVLAGILSSQSAGVLAAYRGQGVALERRIMLGEWVTLVLQKSGAPRRRRAPLRT